MTDARESPSEADDTLAAEYVLGVLDAAERADAETRIKRDPGFAALVVAWENRMGGLNDGFAEAPAPNLLPAIEARLFPRPSRAGEATGGWFSGIFGWVSGALVGAFVVLAAVAFVAPPRTMLIATLATPDQRLAYEVVEFGGAIKVTRIEGDSAGEGLAQVLADYIEAYRLKPKLQIKNTQTHILTISNQKYFVHETTLENSIRILKIYRFNSRSNYMLFFYHQEPQ